MPMEPKSYQKNQRWKTTRYTEGHVDFVISSDEFPDGVEHDVEQASKAKKEALCLLQKGCSLELNRFE